MVPIFEGEVVSCYIDDGVPKIFFNDNSITVGYASSLDFDLEPKKLTKCFEIMTEALDKHLVKKKSKT